MALFGRKRLQTRDPDPFPPWNPPIWNQNLAGVSVTDSTALGIVTLWRCVDLISSTIGSLSVHAFRDGERIDTPQILMRPNPTENRIDTYSALITSALLRGNAYALMGDFDRFGHPRQLVVLDPDAVQVEVSADTGSITYKVGQEAYTRFEMMHMRGFMRPGHVVGQGILDAHRHALGLAIAEHEWTDIAGRVGPDNSLWIWAWSRFPDLVCDGLLNVNETRQVRVHLRDGGQAEGFPDARLSQRGQLVLLSGGSAPTELGPYPIDDILSVTASDDCRPR